MTANILGGLIGLIIGVIVIGCFGLIIGAIVVRCFGFAATRSDSTPYDDW